MRVEPSCRFRGPVLAPLILSNLCIRILIGLLHKKAEVMTHNPPMKIIWFLALPTGRYDIAQGRVDLVIF